MWLFNDLLIFHFVNKFHLTQKHLFKASASARNIAAHTLNFLEQILAGWDSRYETLDVPGGCGFSFKACICAWYIKKNYHTALKSENRYTPLYFTSATFCRTTEVISTCSLTLILVTTSKLQIYEWQVIQQRSNKQKKSIKKAN